MAYLAAAVDGDTRARFFDVISMNGLAQVAAKYPNTTVIFADKTQRAKTAPSVDCLFGLLVSRAKPMATETGWHRCSLVAARRLIVNVLENPDAEIRTFDGIHARAGGMTKAQADAAAAKAKAEAEAAAKARAAKAKATKAKADTHGYVYAFAHKQVGWLKIGQTDNDDQKACWDRITGYFRQHSLPTVGWEFVGFIPTKAPPRVRARNPHKIKSVPRCQRQSQRVVFL
jgi:hypothetical protein